MTSPQLIPSCFAQTANLSLLVCTHPWGLRWFPKTVE